MNILIVSLLLMTIFTNNIMCMDDPMPVPAEVSSFVKAANPLQLPHPEKTFCSAETTKINIKSSTDLLHEFILNTHKYVGIAPAKERRATSDYLIKQARNFFVPISSVNKEMYEYANHPDVIRTVIGNVSNNYHQNRVVQLFATPGAHNYFTYSEHLYNSCMMLDITSIKDVIQQGADVNYFPEKNGLLKPLLMRAAEQSSTNTDFLLKAGANPNITCRKNGRYYTPLSCAITARNYAAIELLLKHKDIDRQAGMDAAIRSKDEHILELFQNIDANPTDWLARSNQTMKDMTTDLADSSISSSNLFYSTDLNPDKILEFVSMGADVNFIPKNAYLAPLLLRAARTSLDNTGTLLCLGADVNTVIFDGSTALSWAIKAGQTKIIKLLLEYNPTNKCLPLAVETKNPEIVQLFLFLEGVDLNEGLLTAQKMDADLIMPLLISAGADPAILPQHSKERTLFSPISIGSKEEYINKALHFESTLTPETIGYHIEQGADVNFCPVNSDFPPVLLRAVEVGFDCTAMLLRLGANPNAINHQGETALAIAIRKQYLPTIKLLLLYDAIDKCLPQAHATGNQKIIALIENALIRDNQQNAIAKPIVTQNVVKTEHKAAVKQKSNFSASLFNVNTKVNQHSKQELQDAIKAESFDKVKFLLLHNPQDECLPEAVKTKNLQIIRLILTQKDMLQSELNAGLDMAVKMKDSILIEILILAGADPMTCLEHNSDAFDLLCQYIE